MSKNIMLVFVGALFAAIPALAGNVPTFDSVGGDAANFFVSSDFIKQLVVAGNVDTFGNQVEVNSDFTPYGHPGTCSRWEIFSSNGSLQADPCFPQYGSHMAGPGRTVNYTWRIVLQYQPESDLNVNILDCVLKHNERNPFFHAAQTGYYRNGNAALAFKLEANPRIWVSAGGGFNSIYGLFPFTSLDARTVPGLNVLALNGVYYTSKAFWEEGIVVKLPSYGDAMSSGALGFELVAGDIIEVKVQVPYKTAADVYYGKDNVIIKYIGMRYTDLNTAKDALLLAPFACQ